MAAENRAKELIDKITSAKKITQNEIGRRAGIAPSYLARLATGDIALTSEKERQIKSAFPEMFRGEMKSIGIPFYNIDFCLGYDAIFNDLIEQPSSYVQHPFNGHAEFWVSTRGNSMYPLISAGDMIALREVQKDGVLFGDIYAIVTDDNRTVKRIRKGSEPSLWKLVPENKNDSDEQEIPVDAVIKVYHVEAVAKPL